MRVSVNRRGHLKGGPTACMAERTHDAVGSDVEERNPKTLPTAAKLSGEPNCEVDVYAPMRACRTCRGLGRA